MARIRIDELDYVAPAATVTADTRLATAQEVSRAATTTVSNALRNAGVPTPAQLATERTRESGGLQPTVSTPVIPTAPAKPINQMTPAELDAYQKARLEQMKQERIAASGGKGGSTATTTNQDLWQMLNGILYHNKIPFTGDQGNQRYKNGVLTEIATKDEKGNLVWKPAGTKGTTNTDLQKPTGAGGSSDVTLVSTGVDPTTGATIGYFSDGSQKVLTAGGLSKVETDAYALLEDTFRNYGLESLVPVIQDYMKKNLGSEQAALQLKQTREYQTRFAGNQIRLAAGQNALSEAEYLNLENSYINTLNAYGLGGYFGRDRKTQVANMGQVIGGDVSATEFADRVNTVVTQVQQGDPRIKAQLKAYYNIDEPDIINYYLNPSKDNLAALKQKTLSAEIGAAGMAQGLGVQKTTAEALAAQGVTQAQAQQGYKTVAEVLPTAQKLSDIYNVAQVGYNQAEAEAEVFGTTGAASAQRKRRQLQQLEAAAFSGSGGISTQISPFGTDNRGKF